MNSKKALFVQILLVLIITIPAFLSILNNSYFSMHDDQHIARLYLLDRAIHQGYFYPRWVDTLGFNFGYPLFNFYPPFIYYFAEIFHLIGFSLIWSVKAIVILGFMFSSVGMYFFARRRVPAAGAILASTLYTFFFYHAVLAYVRGAFAEFFTLAILPFVFLTFENLLEQPSFKKSLFFAIIFALLILTHPLIAFPALFFLGFYFVFYLFQSNKDIFKLIVKVATGGAIGILLSAFFWLPSIVERKYTLVDQILTTELASYKIHFVCPSQLWYSPWGYGGSIAGCFDGFTFQLGKIHLLLLALSIFFSGIYWLKKKQKDQNLKLFIFYVGMLLFSLLMATEFSALIWDNLKFLWYLQFPWRFLTFADFFIAVSGSFLIYFLQKLINKKKLAEITSLIVAVIFILGTIFVYQKYFKPDHYISKTDNQLTEFGEISWRISRTSFEFIPKGVKTTKSDLNTTIPDIQQSNIKKDIYQLFNGGGRVQILTNKMGDKEFNLQANSPLKFRLLVFNFPGWTAYLDGEKVQILDINPYKLITVPVQKGNHNLQFVFRDTPIRTVSNWLSSLSIVAFIYLLFRSQFKKEKRGPTSRFNKAINKPDR